MRQLSHEITSLRLLSSRCNAVATTTPSLWAKMHIFPFDPLRSPPIPILAQWFERSAPLLLDLKFTFSVNRSDPSRSSYAEITSALAPSIARWRSAQFWVCSLPMQTQFLLELPFASAISLTSLALWGLPGYDEDAAVSLFAHLEAIPAPGLLSLELSDAGKAAARAMAVAMPHTLTHITRLHLECWSDNWMDVWRACQLCTSATWISFVWDEEFDDEHTADAPPTTALPNLRILELEIYISSYTDIDHPILPGFIQTPNLKLLSIKQPEPSSFPIAERITSFIQTSRCSESLHALRISGIESELPEEFFETPNIIDMPVVEVTVDCDPSIMDLVRGMVENASSDGRKLGFVQSDGGYVLYVGWTSDVAVPDIKKYLIRKPLTAGLPAKEK